jgi:CRP-like cAMP-binding protein
MITDSLRGRCSTSNLLLGALPPEVLQRWVPQLEWVDMPQGQILREPGQVLRHVYFPTTAIISVVYVTAEGESAEVAVVGNEGVVGTSLFLGSETALAQAIVQTAGGGFRLKRELLMDEFERQGEATHLLLRYTQAMITQMAQSAVCNRYHTLDQQLCRWLLQRLDRLNGAALGVTHEVLGRLLGVRRESVTLGIAKLQAAGLLRHSRGIITVLDRVGLERRSCECYDVVRKEFERLLPFKAAARPVSAVSRTGAIAQAA